MPAPLDAAALRREIVVFTRQFHEGKPYGPTIREIADHVGRATSIVYYHVNALVECGVLARDPGLSRTLRTRERASVEAISAAAIDAQLTGAGQRAIDAHIADAFENLAIELTGRSGYELKTGDQSLVAGLAAASNIVQRMAERLREGR